MKVLLPILSLFVVLLSMACASTKEQVIKNKFTFVYQGVQYQIVSVNTKSGEGTNHLVVLHENGSSTITARDLDQDGILDILLDPSSSLTEENLIYQTGISAAKDYGNLKHRESLRTYETSKRDTLLSIKTYIEPNNISNLFSITILTERSEFMFKDIQADGVLDLTEKGTMELNKANLLYLYAIKRGFDDHRIHYDGTSYIVKEVEKIKTSHYDTETD